MTLKQIFSFENLLAAHKVCRLSKQHKRGTIMFEMELGTNITKLENALTTKTYRLGTYKKFKIFDPKERLIEALPYRDRVVLMCFCKNVLEPRLNPCLIYDNAASRCGKGPAFAVKRLHGFMKKLFIKNGNNKIYFLKCDVAKYFPSIDHDILLHLLAKHKFSDDEMWFMTQVIKSHGEKGIPLGNQTSQWFAVLYLNEIDRLIKEKLQVKCYTRYMDDFVLLSEDKNFLVHCKNQIQKTCQEKLNLNLNAKTQIGQLKNGVDYLGFNHRLTSSGKIEVCMRKSAKLRQRHYLKAISYFYLNNQIDDFYLLSRINAYRAHLKGSKNLKFINNYLQSLVRKKKILTKASNYCC